MKPTKLALLAITASVFATGAYAASDTTTTKADDMNSRPMASATASKTVKQTTDGKVSQLTNDFVKNASITSEFEVETAKLALDRSESKNVRDFAQKMLDDHKTDADKLAAAAPSDIDHELLQAKLDKAHQEQYDSLKNTKDEQFDAAYIASQRKTHDTAVSWFDKYSRKGDEKDLRDYAKSQLPTLKTHMQEARLLKAEPATASK